MALTQCSHFYLNNRPLKARRINDQLMLLDRAFLDPLAFPEKYAFRYEASLSKHPGANDRSLMNTNSLLPDRPPFARAVVTPVRCNCRSTSNTLWHHTGTSYGPRGHRGCPPSPGWQMQWRRQRERDWKQIGNRLINTYLLSHRPSPELHIRWMMSFNARCNIRNLKW